MTFWRWNGFWMVRATWLSLWYKEKDGLRPFRKEVRLFLDEAGYQQVLISQKQGEIRIKRNAHVIEGHILLKKKRRRY